MERWTDGRTDGHAENNIPPPSTGDKNYFYKPKRKTAFFLVRERERERERERGGTFTL